MKRIYKSLFLVLAALFSFSFAFAETGTETNPTSSTKNVQLDCQSFYIAGDFIPSGSGKQYGTMANTGLKLRTNSLENTLTFTVNQPYTIKKIVLDGYANDAGKDATLPGISVTKVEVDGVETTFTGGEFPVSGDQTSAKLTIDNINAAETITLTFDNSNVTKTSQIVVSWSIDWERPDATQPTITVSPKAIKLIPGATYKVSAKVDPNTFTTAWVSDNEAVATVAEDGTVTAVTTGVANIINRWDSNANVADTAVVTVANFDPAKYEVVKQFDFTTMGEVALTIESEAAGNIWNQANKKTNAVFFCTNEGLEDIAVQAVLDSKNKGWSITEAGLTLGSGAGRCAAVGHLYAGQVVEIVYTGSQFYTGSKEDATMKDDGAVKTALNEGVGRAIYRMKESGMLGFEIATGKAIEKIIVYQLPVPTIANANFDANAEDVVTVTLQGYQRNVTGDQLAGMQAVTSWTPGEQTASDPGYCGGVFAYGSENLLNNKVAAPAAAPEGIESPYCLGLSAVWAGVAQYTQDVVMPAGSYKLVYTVFNGVNTGAVEKNLFGFIAEGAEYLSDVKTFAVGEWTTLEVPFTLAEETAGKISLGFIGAGGSGAAPHLFVDNVQLVEVPAIEGALADLKAAIDAAQAKAATYTIGEGLFMYAASEVEPLTAAIATAQAAYDAAESKEAVEAATADLNAFVAAFAPAMTKPAADKLYSFQLRLDGETPLYMALAEGGITIAEKATALKFIETETEGQFNLSNEDGTLFVGLDGGNAWTMSTTVDKKAAWTFTALPDGAYRINNLVTAGRFVGTNASEKAAGSPCYADKKTDNGNVDWLIAEYAPEPVKTDYTDYIVNADLTTADAGFDATGTKGIDGSGIVKVGNAAAFDFKQTIENLPAGKYKVTAQAAYRYGADEAAEYEAMTTSDVVTKLVQLYATVGTKTVAQPVQNRYDGASETDLAGSGAVVIDGKYVPNSSSAVKAWFDAGMYVNEVEFNLPADGAVTIGINRISTPESDYTVIGPWTLTRLGDAEQEPEPEPQPGDDMTKFIVNNSFETGNTNGWTYEASNDHGAKRNDNPTYSMTNCDGDYLFNIWSSGNAISQTIENIPNGTYKLQAVIATDGGHKVQLNANDKNVQIDAIDKGTGIEAELEFLVLQNKATIGAEGVDKYWYKVDNFRLTYLKAFDIDDLITAYNDALAAAQALDGKMNADVKTALTAAIAAEVDKTNADALTAATAALAEATANAKASIAAYANAAKYLPVNKAELENTNVYTAEAYKENITDVEAGYEDGTLTDAKANSLTDVRTGWRAENYIDDILMSAWDANVMDWDTYHVNTWSTEGDGDGSNFTVPFIEYWTGDGDSLGEKTLTATMSGLQKGIYDVTAWVRVRIKNGAEAPAAGIFFQANDSEGVSVVGDQFGSSQFYLKEVATQGEVVADGVLNIKFNVAAGNNISWLAFKNVKFAFNEDATNGIMNVNVNKQPETIYNLRGQRVEKAVKGLYIINGKKTVVK